MRAISLDDRAGSSNVSLMAGGPLYRLARRAGVTGGGRGFLQLGVALAVVTWAPLLLLAQFGREDAAISFFHSLGTHARLLVALPLFFVAEALFDERARETIVAMVASRLVPPARLIDLRAALRQALAWRDSWAIEAVLVIITTSFILEGLRSDLPAGMTTWRTSPEGGFTPAGWWYTVVSLPLFQFVLWRWCGRMLIWWRLLWRINRLELQLVPTHPDLAGGIGGFGDAHVMLAPLGVGITMMLAATFAEEIRYGSVDVTRFVLPLTGAVCAITLLVVAPLLTFAPRLIRLKQRGLLEYATLAARYVREFDDKWVRQDSPSRQPLLGSPDIQSLADLANSFDVIRKMRFVPIALSQVLLIVAATALPAAPLVLFVVPFDELIVKAAKALLNV